MEDTSGLLAAAARAVIANAAVATLTIEIDPITCLPEIVF